MSNLGVIKDQKKLKEIREEKIIAEIKKQRKKRI